MICRASANRVHFEFDRHRAASRESIENKPQSQSDVSFLPVARATGLKTCRDLYAPDGATAAA
jgi:hypothetical protein